MDSSPTLLKPLTSIRGIAALWVYLYHCRAYMSDSAFVREFVLSGYYGVDIFFILSGFIISYTHGEEFGRWHDIKKNAKNFLALRLARIYPLHFLTLLPFVLLNPTIPYETGKGGVGDIAANFLLVQSWGFSSGLYWNMPSWSVSVEWLLYLCFPLLAFCTAKAAAPRRSLLAIGLSLGLWVLYICASGKNIVDMAYPGLTVPRGLLDFIIGMALCNLFRAECCKKLPWDAVAVAAPLSIIAILWLRSQHIAVHDVFVIALAALLIYALANIRGFGHYVFSNRTVVYLGLISYSFYMCHFPYVLMTQEYAPGAEGLGDFFSPGFAAKTLGMVAVAALCFHGIESPLRRLSRRMLGRDKTA